MKTESKKNIKWASLYQDLLNKFSMIKNNRKNMEDDEMRLLQNVISQDLKKLLDIASMEELSDVYYDLKKKNEKSTVYTPGSLTLEY